MPKSRHTQRYKPTKNFGDKCSRCGKGIKSHVYGRARGLYCKASDAKASFKSSHRSAAR